MQMLTMIDSFLSPSHCQDSQNQRGQVVQEGLEEQLACEPEAEEEHRVVGEALVALLEASEAEGHPQVAPEAILAAAAFQEEAREVGASEARGVNVYVAIMALMSHYGRRLNQFLNF
jgi:hypothetical protein